MIYNHLMPQYRSQLKSLVFNEIGSEKILDWRDTG